MNINELIPDDPFSQEGKLCKHIMNTAPGKYKSFEECKKDMKLQIKNSKLRQMYEKSKKALNK